MDHPSLGGIEQVGFLALTGDTLQAGIPDGCRSPKMG
jgi:hypothetical protein